MLTLIMLGLIGQQLALIGPWFWGLYVASWILWVIKLIIEVVYVCIMISSKD